MGFEQRGSVAEEEPKAQASKAEQRPFYNFEEIEEIEPDMVALVEKLKDKIENGEYDTLISDEVGGRIPTLILRDIIQKKNKESREKRKISTYFMTGGKGEYIDEEEMEKFIRKISPNVKKALVVTEYTAGGASLARLTDILEANSIQNFDYASVLSAHGEHTKISNRHEFFYGGTGPEPSLYRTSSTLGGVQKERTAEGGIRGVHPRPLKEIFKEIKEKYSGLKLTPAEEKAIPENVQKARQDVKVLAERVLSKVWHK